MKILITLFFLIKINYPSNDLEQIRYINKIVDASLKQYCFLGIEYDITFEDSKADVTITPCVQFYDPIYLGTTDGTIHLNKDIYGIPDIKLAKINNDELLTKVLVHEVGHFLGYVEHSLDPQSIYYPTLDYYKSQYITRYDSIKLYHLLNFK